MSANREIINPKTLFQAEGFNHAASTTGTKTIYVSGQLPWDKDFQVVGEGDLKKQTEKSLENIGHVLDEVGASWKNVMKFVTYTTKPEESEMISKIKVEYLKGIETPPDTLIGVTELADPRCFIEIEAIVVI